MNLEEVRWVFWLARALQCLVLLAWIVCTLIALFGLRKQKVSDAARALWALLVVAVPVLGAVAFWIVKPQADDAVG
jgi:hypothetical protein